MSDPYDSYDYQNYWKGREYEHESEVLALKKFLKKIKNIKTTLEVGAGFGRITPIYAHRTKKILFTDPSNKNIKEAKFHLLKKEKIKNEKIEFKKANLKTLGHLKGKKFDLIVMIRVMHHLISPQDSIETLRKLQSANGYLILEFANKIHFKEVIKHILKGDFKFINDETPIDRRSSKNIKNKTLPFINYHPKTIIKLLEKNDYKILGIESVSNVRSPFLKAKLPKEILIELESILQFPMGKIFFGPSIFILAQKRG